MTEFRNDTFTHILVGDVAAAQKRLQEADTPTNRRDLVRAVFAAIERLHWQLKRHVLLHELDFGHIGWANLKETVDVRNRFVHPKAIEDLTVADSEINKTLSAFNWVLALQ